MGDLDTEVGGTSGTGAAGGGVAGRTSVRTRPDRIAVGGGSGESRRVGGEEIGRESGRIGEWGRFVVARGGVGFPRFGRD